MKKIIKGLLLLFGVCLLCACSNNKNTESKINVDNNGFLTKESIKDIQEKNNSDKTVNIDKNKTILVYCRSGKRATTAVEKLKSLGYTAYNMGGLDNIDLPKK